jgi:hypothetical protein
MQDATCDRTVIRNTFFSCGIGSARTISLLQARRKRNLAIGTVDARRFAIGMRRVSAAAFGSAHAIYDQKT